MTGPKKMIRMDNLLCSLIMENEVTVQFESMVGFYFCLTSPT